MRTSHALEGEFREDATIKDKKADGQVGETRRVLSKTDREATSIDPQADVDVDANKIWGYVRQNYPPKTLQLLKLWMEEDGITQKEIASKLGIDQSTVSRRLTNMLEKLRKKFAQP